MKGMILHPSEILALQAGRLTQLRRPVKPSYGSCILAGKTKHKIDWQQAAEIKPFCNDAGRSKKWFTAMSAKHPRLAMAHLQCPYEAGSEVFAKETFSLVPATAYRQSVGVEYRVSPDGHSWAVYRSGWDRSQPGPWKSAQCMPAWASRFMLSVEAVRVQRVQQITHDDCWASKTYEWLCPAYAERCKMGSEMAAKIGKGFAWGAFAAMWEQRYGTGSWGWWCWVYSIRKVEK